MANARIRMFRQGLGDSFLLTFPGDQGEVHVLIDFGVLLGTPGAKTTMQRMAGHIVDSTGGKLDVLVATHEHWDHVSGFGQAQDELAVEKLDVSEVWVAWTEKPGEPLAEELRGRRAAAHTRIAAAAHQLDAVEDPGAKKMAGRLNSILEFWGGMGAAGRVTTQSAMDWVKNRTQPKPPKYLFPGTVFALPGARNVRVYVLGPPHDKKWVKKSDPTKSASEVYELAAVDGSEFGLFAAIDALGSGDSPEGQPFAEWFQMSDADPKTEKYPFFDSRYVNGEAWRKVEHDWLGPAGSLALQLDADTNNTSLVLAFELVDSGRVLLFPADAQVGNWMSWNDHEWEVEEDGRTKKVKAKDLLGRTVFYKVGHHGSHNATLRDLGLERMTDDGLVAMLPLHRPTAIKMEWNMPFPSLHERLLERCKGRILDLELGKPKQKGGSMTQDDWDRFGRQVDEKDDWIDYNVPL